MAPAVVAEGEAVFLSLPLDLLDGDRLAAGVALVALVELRMRAISTHVQGTRDQLQRAGEVDGIGGTLMVGQEPVQDCSGQPIDQRTVGDARSKSELAHLRDSEASGME